jgi:hypothetical protein
LDGKENLKMSELPGRHLLAPKSEGATSAKAAPKVEKSERQKQNRSVSVETQAFFCILLTLVRPIVLLALAGARQ